MKLIVCSTREQQRQFKALYPDELVKCVGDVLHGYQVSEIVDETIPEHELLFRDPERVQEWWEYARCRVRP